MYFRNDHDEPTFVIEGVDDESLPPSSTPYDHFKRKKRPCCDVKKCTKNNLVCEVYLERLKSGPIEEFAKADKDTPILTNPYVIPH